MLFLKQITFDDVKNSQTLTPKRRRFSDNPIIKACPNGQYAVSPPFSSINDLFQRETRISTRAGPYGPFCYLSDQSDIDTALEWQRDREHLIFLRDLLDSAVALDFNFASFGEYTELGRAEHEAKVVGDHQSIRLLSSRSAELVSDLAFYAECDAICAVPPSPEKERDLPSEIVARIAQQSGKRDVSGSVRFSERKGAVKTAALRDKWAALVAGNLVVDPQVRGLRIILIDDKYQSGTTAQFVASELYEAGTLEVHGLFMVKTWRDTDNC